MFYVCPGWLQFCKEFKFERMGAFAFSEEEGTPAAELPEQVRDDHGFGPRYR